MAFELGETTGLHTEFQSCKHAQANPAPARASAEMLGSRTTASSESSATSPGSAAARLALFVTLFVCDSRRRRPRLSGVKGALSRQPTRDHVSAIAEACYIAYLTSLSRGRGSLDRCCCCYRRLSLGQAATTWQADTKLPAYERAQEEGWCVCARPASSVAAAICGSAAGFDALRHRLYIHNLVCEGHLQKYKAGRSGNVDHVLHTSHSVVP